MRVLVIGASRGIGWETLGALKGRGHSPVALARSPYRPDPRISEDNWISADVRDAEAVERSMDRIEAVIMALGIAHRDLFTPTTLFSDGTDVVLDAMKSRGVRRLVVVTGFGAGRSRPAISPWQRLPFDVLFGRAYRDKDRQETLIIDSGLDWTIVRPGVLTNGPGTSNYKALFDPSQWRNGVISRKDVADFLAGAVSDPELIRRDMVLVG